MLVIALADISVVVPQNFCCIHYLSYDFFTEFGISSFTLILSSLV